MIAKPDPVKVHTNRAARSSDTDLIFWLNYNLLDQPEARPYLLEAAKRLGRYQASCVRLKRWIILLNVGLLGSGLITLKLLLPGLFG